jgi:hypothetical protein
MSSKIPVGRHDFCQASFSVAPSNPQLSRRHTCASASTRHHHHLTYRRPFLRTGVTLSPHLSLRAPPLPAHSLSRLDTAPAHKEGLEAPHRLKGHTGTGLCNHGDRRKSPRYCQFPRTGHLTSSSTAPLPRQPPAQWYAPMSSSDMAFASLPLPCLGTIAHDRTRWRCMPRNRGRG